MDRKIALLLGSLGVAGAQKVAYAPGHGVAKSTYAASDPVSGREWMVKYLPVSEAPDDCTGGICTCTTAGTWEIQQGRVQLDEESGGRGFGLHLVNLTARATTGGATVEAVEAAWTARLGDMTKFDAFMDLVQPQRAAAALLVRVRRRLAALQIDRVQVHVRDGRVLCVVDLDPDLRDLLVEA